MENDVIDEEEELKYLGTTTMNRTLEEKKLLH